MMLTVRLVFLTIAVLYGLAAADGYALRTVREGDTLAAIAGRYNISLEALMAFNDLDSTLLHPGQLLRIPYVEALGGRADLAPAPPPGFRRHTLASGETLSDVADDFGVTLVALVGANPDLSSLDLLPVGVELLIPPVGSEGLVYTLAPGESLVEVLGRFGLSPIELARTNSIRSPEDVRAGMMVYLPGVPPTGALERLAKVRELEQLYRWPVHGRITSYFGRRSLGMGTARFHQGLDVAAPYGTAVRAARSGTVTFAGWSGAYGYLVRIRHAGNEETWYAHHSEVLVETGQYVKQEQVIGRIGSTGLSTGPHLHFEIHEQGRPVDPLSHLN